MILRILLRAHRDSTSGLVYWEDRGGPKAAKKKMEQMMTDGSFFATLSRHRTLTHRDYKNFCMRDVLIRWLPISTTFDVSLIS